MENNEYYQPPQPAVQHKSTTAMGIVSLVLGILAIVSSWIPIVNNFSALLALLGAIFGVIGIVGVVRGKKSGKAIAIAGTALNVVAVVVVLATQSMYSAAIDDAMGASASTATQNDSASATQPAASADKQDASQASDYAVSIDSAVVTADYQGNPALVVTYTWTNNSDEATSFAAQLLPKCFQNGVQLDTAVVVDGVDSNGYVNEVKPGATTSVQLAYALADDSIVSVEVSPVINWNNTVLATADFDVA